jgi:hypothetical protein
MDGTLLLVKAESVLPNYRETSQTPLRVRVRLGLRKVRFSFHVFGALEQGLCNSPGTKGEGRGLFCNVFEQIIHDSHSDSDHD